jgi:hypothetical protein
MVSFVQIKSGFNILPPNNLKIAPLLCKKSERRDRCALDVLPVELNLITSKS